MTFGTMSDYLDNLNEHSILIVVLVIGMIVCSNSISTLMAVSLITFLMSKDFTTSLIVGGLLYVSITNMQDSGQENLTFNEDGLLRFNVLSKDHDEESDDEESDEDDPKKSDDDEAKSHDSELHKVAAEKLKSVLAKLDKNKHKSSAKKHVSDSEPIETPSIGQYACSKHNKNPTVHKYVLDNVHTRDIDSVEMYEGAEASKSLNVSQCLDDSARCLSE